METFEIDVKLANLEVPNETEEISLRRWSRGRKTDSAPLAYAASWNKRTLWYVCRFRWQLGVPRL